MTTRNPIAKAVRLIRPQQVPDKRRAQRERDALSESEPEQHYGDEPGEYSPTA